MVGLSKRNLKYSLKGVNANNPTRDVNLLLFKL